VPASSFYFDSDWEFNDMVCWKRSEGEKARGIWCSLIAMENAAYFLSLRGACKTVKASRAEVLKRLRRGLRGSARRAVEQ
jgi:hypothetical protein